MKIIITESQYKFLVENQEVVDRILDKISEIGYESLSIEEQKYLNHFSKHSQQVLNNLFEQPYKKGDIYQMV